jgi:hypothetical protein
MKAIVSGQYRYDVPGHAERGLKDYRVEVDLENDIVKKGDILLEVQEYLKKGDSAFDSLKTHAIELVE